MGQSANINSQTALSYSSIAPLILGFSTIGFYLLYLGYRYNAIFTLGTNVSTQGASYARAMKQLITGIYLSEICLLGLFGIGIGKSKQSIGPLVLMFAFLVATIAWQIWLGRSLSKLEDSVSLEQGPSVHESTDVEKNGSSSAAEHNTKSASVPAPPRKTGFVAGLREFFYPDTSAASISRIVSENLAGDTTQYTQEEHDEAYIHPAIISEVPIIWIARDKYGLSKQEIAATQKEAGEAVEITDEGAWFDDKGKVAWSEEIQKAPIYEDEKIY